MKLTKEQRKGLVVTNTQTHYTRKKVLGHTWLGWLNKLILQWLFIRLAEELHGDSHNQWVILRWVWPTTGWTTDYKFVGNP